MLQNHNHNHIDICYNFSHLVHLQHVKDIYSQELDCIIPKIFLFRPGSSWHFLIILESPVWIFLCIKLLYFASLVNDGFVYQIFYQWIDSIYRCSFLRRFCVSVWCRLRNMQRELGHIQSTLGEKASVLILDKNMRSCLLDILWYKEV